MIQNSQSLQQRGAGTYSSFDVSVSPTLGSDNEPVKTYPDGKFEVILSGLTPGTVYTITMRAISGDEKSADLVESFYTSKFISQCRFIYPGLEITQFRVHLILRITKFSSQELSPTSVSLIS